MSLIDNVKTYFRTAKPIQPVAPSNIPKTRKFEAARTDRFNADWGTWNTNLDINLDFSEGLQTLKIRSRDLIQNSTIANAYSNLMVKNTIGSEGISLKNKSLDANGKPDTYANYLIEQSWNDFSYNCSVKGTLTLKESLRLMVQSLCVDGEVIVVSHENFPNKYGYAIEIKDTLELDPTLNRILENGNQIICGIEMDRYQKPLNYYFKTLTTLNQITSTYEIVPANRVRHIFFRKFPKAVRGFPPLAPVMKNLKIIDAYIEAELIAARTSSSKMGFITTTGEAQYKGEGYDSDGSIISEISPGTVEVLGAGQDFKSFDPQHPTSAFEGFIKTLQKQISAALDISYNSLVSDFESTSYSSMRSANISDKETYKLVQEMLIEGILYPVFEKWLAIQIVKKNVNLPMVKFDKFNMPLFMGKRQPWVDPVKEIEAAKTAIELGTLSRTRFLAEQGQDFVEVMNEIKLEQEAIRAAGIVIGENKNGSANSSKAENTDGTK